MYIHLVSAPNREDIIDGYKYSNKYFWPECDWPIVAMDGECSNFTQRLIDYLKVYTEPFFFMNLDDYYLVEKVDHQETLRAYEYIKSHDDVGRIILQQIKIPELPCDLTGYGEFDNTEPLYKKTIFLPSIYRRQFMLDMANEVLHSFENNKQLGWPGAYNFELYTGVLSGRAKVLSSKSDSWPHRISNIVEQGKWHPQGIELLRRINYNVDLTRRGIHTSDDNPYMNAWEASRDSL